MKVLVSAYACNPYKGSEEGVGWNWVKMIAGFCDPWVLVAGFHREDIEHFLEQHPDQLANVHFVYIPHKPWHYQPSPGWKRIEGSVLKPFMNLAYALWLRDAGRQARQLHARMPFAMAHQLTYVGFRFPGRLWQLDIPFVWGPVGGLENTAWRFLPVLGWKGAIYYAGRNIINSVQRLLLRSPRKAFKKAEPHIIAATSGIQRQIYRWYGRQSQVICEVGPPEVRADRINQRQAHQSLQLVWSGEHLPGKALPLLLQALAQLEKNIAWHLDILGHGPLTETWQAQARELGLDGNCVWHGLLPRKDALAVMSQGHLFVITSLKDLTSTVLLEAMSLGLPVVCPDHCGFSDVVDEHSGIRLPLETPEGLVRGYAAVIVELAGDEKKRRKLAQGAVVRAGVFSWEQKRIELEKIYNGIL